jgi:HEAT repeat protein
MSFVARAIRVRPGEGRIAGLLVGVMFVSSASVAIGESGIDGLFFARVGTRSLPLMYLLQAGATFVVLLGLAGAFTRLGRRRTYLGAPVVLAATLVLERVILVTDVRWIYPVLWVTVPVGMLVQGTYVWGVAGAVTDTRQAKRLFPLFAAGGILGSVAGGLATRAIAASLGAQNLGLVWAGGLVAALVGIRMTLGPAPSARARRRVARRTPSALREVTQALAYVRRSRLLVWMTAAAVLFSVLYYSLYLPYAAAATQRYPNADALAGFFGVFWAAVTGAAFLVSIFGANRLFARVGVAAIVVVLPVLYAGAFATVLIVSGFVAIVGVRFVTVLWLQGVASPGWETLINVVPESRRDQTRAFINGGPTQAGTAIAGLVALVGRDVLSPRQFAAVGLVAALLTAAVAIAIRRAYAGALLDALRAGRPQLFRGVTGLPTADGTTDAGAIHALTLALGDPDVHVRRLAFGLLAGAEPGDRPAELRAGVTDSDPHVRAIVARTLDPATVADRDALLELMRDADPRVVAAAAARALGGADAGVALERIRSLMENADNGVRAAAAEELRSARGGEAAGLAAARLADAAPVVRAAALATLAELDPQRGRAAAVAAIRDPDPAVRTAAGRALGASGAAALDDVLDALMDPASADGGAEAVRTIEAPEAAERIRAFAAAVAVDAARYREAAIGLAADGPASRLLADMLLDRARRTGRSAMWALTIVTADREAAETAIENLDGDATQVAAALETLESTVDRHLVAPLLALWEPVPAARVAGTDAAFRIAAEDDDPLIRATAELVLNQRRGGTMTGSTPALSLVERVLHLGAIPLLADLTPSDLERVAAFAEERTYTTGETIAAEGELGAELHVVVEGEVAVVRDGPGGEIELARRTSGEVIGEMSIITRGPRVASLIAVGDVRTVTIGRREFESLLRERPDVALAVMRTLANRVAEYSRAEGGPSVR